MRRTTLMLISMLSLALPTYAADDLVVVGALDFAFKDMTLEPGGGGGGSQKFNTTLTTINPGVALAYKRFYANINFDKSIDSASTTQLEQSLPAMLTMSRADTVLTLGFRAYNFLSLYAGWLSGDIGAYLIGQRQLNPGPPIITAFYTQDISYTEKGPFAGIALSHNLGEKGSVSLSVAYASLDGEMSQTRYTGASSDGLTLPSTTYDKGNADVKGLSYNLIWTGPLNGNMNYRLGVKSTRYEGSASGPGAININEYYTAFFLGLTNTF